MTIRPYPDEAVSSWLLRAGTRGLIELEEGECLPATDLEAYPDTLRQLGHLTDAPALLNDLAAHAIRRRWPAAVAQDLDSTDPPVRALAKVCEACLAEDAALGLDHYVRQEWRFSWRISCSRHGYPLVDVEQAELAPVTIGGSQEWRVRLLRDYDLVMDPWLSRTDRGGGGRRVKLPAPLLCLEADVMASLAGKDFPSIWSCGHDWSVARPALLDLVDILLTRARNGKEHLVHRVLVDERALLSHTPRFSKGALNFLQAAWQRLVLGALATLLVDPECYEHALDGQPWKAHAQLIRQPMVPPKLRSRLGRLVIQDLWCVILAGADIPALEIIETQLERWPPQLRRRARNAAAVALYVA